MHPLSIAIIVAQQKDGGFGELTRDPLLSVACVSLIVVCVLWVALGRRITRNLDRRSLQAQKKKGSVKPARDIWTAPPR